MEKSDVGPKLQQLENFLLKPESEESKNYISTLLEGKLGRPEEAFVNEFLNKDFWKELGYAGDEVIIERIAGIKGRVELSLDFDGKKIGVECKRPYNIKKEKEVINELKGDDINELEDQLGQYLDTHDFIIFTNGFYWFFYSRESHRAWQAYKNKKDNKLKPYFKYLTAEEIFSKKSADYILNILGRNVLLEALNAMEHKSIRHVLTDDFFSDLKTWVGYIDTALSHIPGTKKARTTSLINKLIFLRTMEAVGVIPIDFLAKNWEAKKGIGKSILNFVDQIDDDFSEIYDTELFTSKYLEDDNGKIIEEKGIPVENPARNKNYVYKDLREEFFSAILKRSDRSNLKDTGFTKLSLNGKDFYVKSLYWWKFEKISADILGKAYETYLARERKKLGIYYTPHQMTEFLASKTVSMVFDEKISKIKSELNKEIWDKEKLNLLGKEFSEITICDPSCGSGSFLIQAMRVVWSKYKELVKIIQEKDDQFAKAKPTLDDYSTDKVAVLRYFQVLLKIDDKQQRMGNIILRHIFGNDKDEKAIDTAKLNIWLECLRLDPNTYRRESLRGKRHVLPNLELNLTVGDSLVDLDVNDINDLVNDVERKRTLESVFKLKELYVDSFDKTSIAHSAAILRDEFISFFAGHLFSEKMGEEFTKNLFSILRPTYWPLQHPSAFFNKDGEPKNEDERGFDVIISNPPWEILEPNIDEFYGPHHNKEDMSRFHELEKKEKNEIIKKLSKIPHIINDWKRYNKEIDLQRDFYRKSKLFKFQTAKTDAPQNTIRPNFYKLFIEKYYFLLKKGGVGGIVVPANFYTNFGSKGLRQLIFEKTKIITLLSFLNKNKIFDIHAQLKFINLIFKKGEKTSKFKAAFKLLDVNELDLIEKNAIMYDISLVKQGSPDSLTLIEINSQEDVKIIKKLLKFPFLFEKSPWKIRFQREFNKSDDVKLFNTNAIGAPLYEGEMIHQFTHEYTKPKYWVETKKGTDFLKDLQIKRVSKEIKKEYNEEIKQLKDKKKGLEQKSKQQKELKQKYNEEIKQLKDKKKELKIPEVKIDFDYYRLGWRDVTNETNRRTLICAILPPHVFATYTIPYLRPNYFNGKNFEKALPSDAMMFLCGLFNSFVIDFLIRQKISIHATMSQVLELPIPRYGKNDPYFSEIVDSVGTLICTTSEYNELKKELQIKHISTEPNERQKLIAQINAYVAKIYDITRSEFEYILSTFPIVDDEIKQQVLLEYDKLD